MNFFKKNVSRPSNPPDELTQNVSKKKFRRTNYSSFFSAKVQNLAVFSFIYMIRIRFFGPRELNQKGFSGARYMFFSHLPHLSSSRSLPHSPIRWDRIRKPALIHGGVSDPLKSHLPPERTMGDDYQNPSTEGTDEIGKVGVEMPYVQSKIHSVYDSPESIATRILKMENYGNADEETNYGSSRKPQLQ